MIVYVLSGWAALSLIAIPVALAFCHAAALGDRQLEAVASPTNRFGSLRDGTAYVLAFSQPEKPESRRAS